MNRRRRIDRLAQRRGLRQWIEPAGERDGVPMEAHVYELANGQRGVVVAPVPCETMEEWAAVVARHARAIGYPLPGRDDEVQR